MEPRQHGKRMLPTKRDAYRDDDRIGNGRRVAYALGIWPTQIVSRSTLRALMPSGETRDVGAQQHWNKWSSGRGTGRINTSTKKFKDALHRYDRLGLIQKGEEFVKILDADELLARALKNVHDTRHRRFLEVECAAEIVAEELRHTENAAARRLREAELQFIRSLMVPEWYPGRDGRRRQVRQESGEITIPLGEVANRAFPEKRYGR